MIQTEKTGVEAPKQTLAGRDLLRLLDLNPDEFLDILHVAQQQKKQVTQGIMTRTLTNRAVAIILEKPSLRTRASFEIGAAQLGAHPLVMADGNSAFSRGESIKDTVMVLERYVSCIVLRTFEQEKLNEVAKWAHVPVINALSDLFHPCQGLADALTILEKKDTLAGIKVAFLGDGNNNMANTYCEMAALGGMHLKIAAPSTHLPPEDFLAGCLAVATQTGGTIDIVDNAEVAVADADVVVTDTWTSMGASDSDESAGVFDAFQVNEHLMLNAKADAIFMHCLPAHRGKEVTDEVMDGTHSAIYDEAENRLHAQRALMSLLIEGN